MSSISPAPTFNLPTRDDLLRSAFSMPFSPMREAWEQAQQSAMTMPLIGRAITPPSNTPPKIVSGMGPAADIFSAVMNAPAVARDLAQNVIGRLPSMTPDEWKASPYYRKEIPYDPGMTEERAAALAWQFDLGQARAFMAEKQAWTGPFGIRMPSLATFAGQFAGGLIDPTNYIPIFGPAARAAAVARFGAKGLLRFGTELTIDAAEAAASVAIFSGLSARERAQYGDDISWQAQINNIAMSAFIGAVMHPIIRGIGLGVAGGKAAATMAADRIAARNFKVADVETARAVMNDVVASIVEKGKPEMSRPAQTVVDKLVQKVAVETQRDNALKAETAAVKGDKAGEVVISPVGTRVNVRAEVVELSSLVQATGDLQGRDTSRLASDARAQEIAANYDPARAMPSIEGDRGAPIVGEDNVIDGGNHRVKALQIVYAAHPDKAEAYKAHLQANGYNIDGFNQPVLIQRRTTPLTPEARSKFAAELNTSATARMSSSEQAAADRAALDDATLKQLAPGPVTSVENRAFVSRFLGNLPSAERTALIDKGGELNADGQRRIENALVAEAYGDVDATVLRRFSEATDDNTRSVVGAMADVAGNWSLLRRAMKRGDVAPEFDTTVELTTALRFLAGAREDAAAQKRPVSIVVKEGMAQLDMLGGGMSDEARAFVRMFYKTDEFKQSAGRDVIAARLQRVINAAEELGQPQLFGDAAAASKLGVISHALNDEQGFLFTDDGARSSDGTVGEGGGAAAAGADSGGSAQETGASGAASRSIADRMSERIVAAGRGGDEAKAIGNLVEAFYVKQAERLGLPVAEFERMFPLPEVRGPGPVGEGALAQVSPEQARRIEMQTKLPADPLFAEAVDNTDGAIITPDGLELDTVRWQTPEQTGDTAVRTGVFYLPKGSKNQRYYKGGNTGADSNNYGGTVKAEARTLLRRPLFVKGATGGKAPEAAFAQLMGKGRMKMLADDAQNAVAPYYLRNDASVQHDLVERFLRDWGGDPSMASEIIARSQKGNQLRYALQEHVIVHEARRAGYDSIVGYSKGRGDKGAFISEVVDLREVTNPVPGEGEVDLHPAFSRTLFQPAFHGTPHAFDRFSTDKIGTGEGAQAYGWGLYFSSSKDVASWYRRTLAGAPRLTLTGNIPLSEFTTTTVNYAIEKAPAFLESLGELPTVAAELEADPIKPMRYQAIYQRYASLPTYRALALRDVLMQIDQTINVKVPDLQQALATEAKRYLENAVNFSTKAADWKRLLADPTFKADAPERAETSPEKMQEYQSYWASEADKALLRAKIAQALIDKNAIAAETPGRLFKVDVPDAHELLDWDAKLVDQPAPVKEKLKALGFNTDPPEWTLFNGMLGKEFVWDLVDNGAILRTGFTEDLGVSLEKAAAEHPGDIDATVRAFEKNAQGLAPKKGSQSTAILNTIDAIVREIRKAGVYKHGAAEAPDVMMFTRGDPVLKSIFEELKAKEPDPEAWYAILANDPNGETAQKLVGWVRSLPEAEAGVFWAQSNGEPRYILDTVLSAYSSKRADYDRFIQAQAGSMIGERIYDAAKQIAVERARTEMQDIAQRHRDAPNGVEDWPPEDVERFYQLREIADGRRDVAASRLLMDAGIPGHTYIGNESGKANFVIYDDKRVNVLDYEQRMSEAGPGGADPRGAINLMPEGTAPVLHILQNADASTAMHEMGHYFLHILKQIADKDNAPFAIKRDLETLKEWWASNADEVAADAPLDEVTADDVKAVLRNGTTGDRVKDLAIDVALQEHWARGFEAYLREGQAPTPGLRGVFEQFKAWLVDVYKRIIDLRVKLSPEVKGVMDRMLGAEDAAATPASTTDANVQKAGNSAENVAQDPGQSALDFAAPPDPAPLPGIAEAEARLSTGPDDMAQLREQFGVDESGGFAEQGDIDLLEAQGLLSPDDKAALDAADVDIKNAESWGDALMTAARCAFRF